MLEADNEGNFSGYVTYAKALNFEDQGRKFEKQGKLSDARSSYENAQKLYKKALDESNGYEPAKQKADEMAALITKLKK
jgi:predicted metalloendopeptidase